ncbi:MULTISPECIES: hypothetical protein [unclassified Chryseobacterium]|uniref:hypothetical protein n=1 Tax=unclassified Chryseobacterium TaxID=2593645 RepID=UPI000F9E145A|nr:hypothetical protein [Chryseobacterium sp. BIGb0232]MCS4304970.1 hypothetical protein [Chryseobacterium sp. BIGb0232]ROS08214.1 hypothetical protein EDF65_4663 [Chryseobacterium nakagawai]
MEDLKKLNIEFKNYLEAISDKLTEDLSHLLNGDHISYVGNNGRSDIRAFYFEYEYEYLNIVFWGVDGNNKIATNTISLPTEKNGNAEENSDWDALIPEKIWMAASDFQDHYEGEDFDDILDEYDDEKYKLFEQWFFDCWKKASEQTKVKMDAYFSIHDTYFRTDLNTLKTINEDEIALRYEN